MNVFASPPSGRLLLPPSSWVSELLPLDAGREPFGPVRPGWLDDAEGIPWLSLICRSADLSALVHEASKKRVFVSANQNATEDLLKAGLRLSRGGRMGELLTLEPPRPESVPALSGLFERVIGASSGYSWLPVEELMTVVSGKDASDRFIGGAADRYRAKHSPSCEGTSQRSSFRSPYFTESGDGTKPDFGNPRSRTMGSRWPSGRMRLRLTASSTSSMRPIVRS